MKISSSRGKEILHKVEETDESEYSALLSELSDCDVDISNLRGLSFSHHNLTAILGQTRDWISSYGNRRAAKSIERLYGLLGTELEDGTFDEIHCLVDGRSPEIVGLVGEDCYVQERIDRLNAKDYSYFKLSSYLIDNKSVSIFIIPMKALIPFHSDE